MTTHCAFDHRAALAPFLPVGRGQDQVFRRVLSICKPEVLTMHLPFAVQHWPEQERQLTPDAVKDAGPRIFEIVLAVIGYAAQASGALLEGFSALGSALDSIASLPSENFKELLRYSWASSLSAHLMRCEGALNEHGRQPDYWAAVVEEHMASAKAELLSANVVPVELEGWEPDAAVDYVRRLIVGYAELIAEWPTIFACALELNGASR
jgi:hypothetical protein